MAFELLCYVFVTRAANFVNPVSLLVITVPWAHNFDVKVFLRFADAQLFIYSCVVQRNRLVYLLRISEEL